MNNTTRCVILLIFMFSVFNGIASHKLKNVRRNESDYKTRTKRGLGDWLMAPNTRWCGKGNTAEEYNNLGGASAADKCCRQHDHCRHNIPAMTARYGLFNYLPYTLSSCTCDRRFRTCLKMSNDEDANAIGKVFFNWTQMRCFILRQEKICRQRNEDGICQREESQLKAYLKQIERY